MDIHIIKSNGKTKCRYNACERKVEFILKGRIKKGTCCAAIGIDTAAGFGTAYYCRDCIDKIYLNMKMVLNPALWVFK